MNLGSMQTLFKDYIGDPNGDDWDNTRITRLLNVAKDQAVAAIEMTDDEGYFVSATTYTVSASSTIHTLPADFKSAYKITRTDGSDNVDFIIIDFRDAEQYQARAGYAGVIPTRPVCYLRGTNLHFLNATSAMTAVMDYAVNLPDLLSTDTTASYTSFPPEHSNVIVLGAVMYAALSENAQDARMWATKFDEAQASMAIVLRHRQRYEASYVNVRGDY